VHSDLFKLNSSGHHSKPDTVKAKDKKQKQVCLHPDGPCGAKGVGEIGLLSIIAASLYFLPFSLLSFFSSYSVPARDVQIMPGP
jgi:hypothetical protein